MNKFYLLYFRRSIMAWAMYRIWWNYGVFFCFSLFCGVIVGPRPYWFLIQSGLMILFGVAMGLSGMMR